MLSKPKRFGLEPDHQYALPRVVDIRRYFRYSMCNIFLAMADIRNNAEWNVIEAGDQQAIIGTLQKYLAASRALSGRTWVVQDESAPFVIRLCIALGCLTCRICGRKLIARKGKDKEEGWKTGGVYGKI
jgi:hypothetical protein